MKGQLMAVELQCTTEVCQNQILADLQDRLVIYVHTGTPKFIINCLICFKCSLECVWSSQLLVGSGRFIKRSYLIQCEQIISLGRSIPLWSFQFWFTTLAKDSGVSLKAPPGKAGSFFSYLFTSPSRSFLYWTNCELFFLCRCIAEGEVG